MKIMPNTSSDTNGAIHPQSMRILRRNEYMELQEREQARNTPPAERKQEPRSGVYIPSHMLPRGPGKQEQALQAGEREIPARQAATPAPKVRDELKDHEYDGIQEYDNPTPGWWYLIFNLTVAFSIVYAFIYHTLVPSQSERHAAAQGRALEARFAELRTLPEGEDKILTIMGEPNWLAQGASVYRAACTLCHGQYGEGLIGPNLTDDYMKSAFTLVGMYEVIKYGAGDGAMPARGGAALHDDEIALVTAYVASLRGKNLEGPRGPEGELAPPFPEPKRFDPTGG